MPYAQGDSAAVQSGQNTLLLGGSAGLIRVPEFAAANPSWKTVYGYTTPLDQPRLSPGAGVLADGTVLMFGGVGAEGETLSSAYDFYGTPGSPASMNSGRSRFGFATDENHHVYAIGGSGEDGGASSSAEYFDQSSNTWTNIASLPQGLSSLSAVADGNGHVFAIGGLDGSGNISSTVYRYTIATNTWDTVASLPVATDASGAVRGSDGTIYVLGGVTSTGTTANVESYNESTNTWTTVTALPSAVSSPAVTSDSLGRIVVAGGFDASNNPTASTYFSQELNQPDAAPVFTTTSVGNAYATSPYSAQILSTGNPQPTYTLTSAPAGVAIDSNTGLISWTPTTAQVGPASIGVQASNYAGSATQTYSLTVVPAAPTGVTATATSTSAITVSWNAVYDPGGVTFTITEQKWVSNGGGKGSHGGHYVYTTVASGLTSASDTITGLGTGSYHTYYVTAVDVPTGLSSVASALVSTQTWYPPTLNQWVLLGGALASDPSATVGQLINVSMISSGNPAPTFTVLSGPSTLSIDPNTGIVNYTPDGSTLGQVNYTIQASNAAGTVSQTYSFNVVPAPTIIFSDGPFTFNGYAFYATATAVGTDGKTPVSGSFAFAYSGPSNPPSFAGTYTVYAYFTSSDSNYGSTTATSTMIINPATAVFSKLLSPTIPVGKASVTLSGYLTDGSLAPASGTIDVTLNGVTQAANLGTGDFFSTTFNTSSLAAGAYAVSYVYVPGDTDFTAPNGASTLYVGAKPHVTVNPKTQTDTAGNNVNFTAAATGTPTPTVQWQVSTDGGKTFSDVSGATSTTLTFVAAASENGDKYRAVFTNALATADSSVATLTVQFAPTVTSDPTSQTVAAGKTVTFTAAATGNPKPTVQWQVSSDGGTTWTKITGATSTKLSFVANLSENGYEYQAVFTNSIGTATTKAATLTV